MDCAASSPGHLSAWHRAHLQGDLPVSPGPGWQFQEVIYILPLGQAPWRRPCPPVPFTGAPLLAYRDSSSPLLYARESKLALMRARKKHWLATSMLRAQCYVLPASLQPPKTRSLEIWTLCHLEALERRVALKVLGVGKDAIYTYP